MCCWWLGTAAAALTMCIRQPPCISGYQARDLAAMAPVPSGRTASRIAQTMPRRQSPASRALQQVGPCAKSRNTALRLSSPHSGTRICTHSYNLSRASRLYSCCNMISRDLHNNIDTLPVNRAEEAVGRLQEGPAPRQGQPASKGAQPHDGQGCLRAARDLAGGRRRRLQATQLWRAVFR